MSKAPPTDRPVILFDGVCNFCNGTVTFVLRRDKNGIFQFAALQSDTGQALLDRFDLPTDAFDTMVLAEGDRIYTKSGAALRVARQLGGLWPLLYAFVVVPRFVRDACYDLVARNRYRWFGKREDCMVPTPDMRDRFLT